VPKTIIDTDILSEIFKQRNATVLANAERYVREFGVLTFASVSVVEILSGLYARDARGRLADVQAFLDFHEQLLPQSEDYKLSAESSEPSSDKGHRSDLKTL
jgi:predicted nucleic acid-binding protein